MSHAVLWVVVLVLIIVQAISHLVIPLYYKQVFDRVIGEGNAEMLIALLPGIAAMFTVMIVAEAVQSMLCAKLGARAANVLREDLLRTVLDFPAGHFGGLRDGDVVARFGGDIAAVERIASVVLYKTVLNGLVAALCLAALFLVEWRLAVFTLAILPCVALIPRAVGRRAAVAGRARGEGDARLADAVRETLDGHRVIRAFSLETHHLDRFRTLLDETKAIATRAGRLGLLVEKSSNLGLIFGQLVVISVGAYLVARGFMSQGDIVAFMGLLFNASGAIGALTFVAPDWIQANVAAGRLGELRALAKGNGVKSAVAAPRFRSEIRFTDVSFSYGAVMALSGVSFVIRAGESVALVGQSGSGKSTVLNLLMGFHTPNSGSITIDGTDLSALSLESLRAQIGCVFQHTHLFDMSIRENIRQGRLQASDTEVENAARGAMVHDAVRGLPQSYDTRLGGGMRMSVGQQQRIAIARAILRDPAILVLDEATAALDPVTEAAINETFATLARDRTLVSVTHRLAAASWMDRILVFDSGHLVEQGNHQELLRRNGNYRKLWDKQATLSMAATEKPHSIDASILRAIPLFSDLGEDGLALLATQYNIITGNATSDCR